MASLPKGHWIKSFSAKILSETSFQLTMTPGNCGHDIPLVSVEGVPRTDEDQQSSFNFTDIGATVSVTRNKAASPPVNGTFDITFRNKTIKGMC